TILESEALSRFASSEQMSRRDEIDRIFSDIMKTRTTKAWEQLFTEPGVRYAPVNDYDAVSSDPQAEWNEMIVTTQHPDAGEVRLVNHPLRFNGRAPAQGRHQPAIGEHSVEILRRHGYDESTIQELIDRGIVVANERTGGATE